MWYRKSCDSLSEMDFDDLAPDDMPEAETLKKLVVDELPVNGSADAPEEVPTSSATTFLPTTLQEALDASHGKSDSVFWNMLLRLAIKLRSASGGQDTGFLQNALNCRRASRKLNWHQLLC